MQLETHNENLINFMRRAEEKGLVFKITKYTIKQTEISFFGNVDTKEGIKLDPKKAHNIRNMQSPENKGRTEKFLNDNIPIRVHPKLLTNRTHFGARKKCTSRIVK